MSEATTPSPDSPPPAATAPRQRLSLDWWAVITSLALAILIRSGAIHKIPW